ncbi:uncharacterized protein LOC127709912 [Mytilus californianus]|uniref:uncharacterized protein LOC127709912 n=1 Tax=Mytilus californianus TaxID=6549 RepID=UPI002245C866|nr:uncharacterized protein LOC127709912 [Mytilus californianus]XP_052071573.1 uncharacterized protein LOC127709912 [Mytilus californianus]
MEQRDAFEVAVLSDDEITGSLTINSDGQEINETHTNRRNCLWSIIFSWIVLPTTAGNLLPGENESQHSRDGKISSLVALKTAVGILVVLMYIRFGSTSLQGLQIKYDIVQILIIIFLVISFFIYLVFIFGIVYYPNSWTYSESKRKHTCLKMLFIVIFTPCNIAYLAIKVSVHVKCTVNPENRQSLSIHIIYECLFIVFLIFQMLFMCMSSGKNLYKSCLIHYAATIVIASNVAIVFYSSLKTHFEEILHHDAKIECFNQTIAFSIYDSSKLYLEPTVIENALLCILVIKEIFSCSHDNQKDHIETQIYAIRGKLMCVTVLAVVFVFPYFLLRILLLHNNDSSNHLYFVQACTFAVLKFIMYIVLIKCFHFLLINCRNYYTTSETPLKLNHYLILFSALGSEVFFGLNFAASVDKVETQTVLYAVNNVLQFITTFVQTVLIIQMKDYKKIEDVSVSATFLFLALVNFGLWLYDTFLEAVYFDHLHYTTLYYGQTTTLTIRHLFVPMVIFYRFKCFLSFFELSAFTPPFVDRLLGAVDKMKRKVCCQRQQSYEEI